jgi:hypothetical protein
MLTSTMHTQRTLAVNHSGPPAIRHQRILDGGGTTIFRHASY